MSRNKYDHQPIAATLLFKIYWAIYIYVYHTKVIDHYTKRKSQINMATDYVYISPTIIWHVHSRDIQIFENFSAI